MSKDGSNRAFFWLVAGVIAALLLPRLAMDGMFMDGQLYSAVAHNQANGLGTFWKPWFSDQGLAGLDGFYEHPPLVFGMQAAWFTLFGSAFWVERLYSLLMAVLQALLLVGLWRSLVPNDLQERSLSWWPLLLWIIVPTVFWCYHNNMMENTMALFTTASIWMVIKAVKGEGWRWYVLGGFFVFLATLAKGVPGAFPLAAPVILGICLGERKIWHFFAASVLMTFVFAALYGALMLYPPAHENLMAYAELRLFHRIAEQHTVVSRFATLEMLFSNMLAPIGLAILLFFLGRRGVAGIGLSREAVGMSILGLAGVLPLMLTMVQKSFYMAAALPIVSVAIALWSVEALNSLLERHPPSAKVLMGLRSAGMLITFGAVVAAVSVFGEAARDKDLLHDVHLVGEHVPEHSLVGLPPDMWNNWSLQTYLMRYHFISLDTKEPDHQWYITQGTDVAPGHTSYLPVADEWSVISLWRYSRQLELVPAENGSEGP